MVALMEEMVAAEMPMVEAGVEEMEEMVAMALI